ncbi:glycosyltransferase [Pedobacter sp. HMF7647]|uniref:Glycosyltransferase n=1 Tax=Hufsiella arboris TaxID=2695275 RepID=A0A7K1YE13_9SPHI|nr:glycosyltransferase family A protein [Hufsiella arboris]MXV52822.1 glycosyltransferase [Hufsiella arboris]
MEKSLTCEENSVSICIPCYNASSYIETTLDSLLNQSHSNIEIIIVDDSSTDDSWEKISKFKDSRLKIFKALRKGASAARNQAYQESSGKYIVFFDADDYVQPDFIQSQVNMISGSTDDVVVSSWGRFYNNKIESFTKDQFIIKENLTFYQWIADYWMFSRHMTPPGRVFVPRKLIASAGLWNEDLTLNDDFDFYCRIFADAGHILYNDKATFFYRSGIGGLSSRIIGWQYQRSNLSSLISGIDQALKLFPEDQKVKLSCANMLQNFIYENYPANSDLINIASEKINKLTKPTIGFQAGGITKKMVRLLGWKLTKQIKNIIN